MEPSHETSQDPAELPHRTGDQRLYVCAGSSWDKALHELFHGAGLEKCWSVKRHYRKGDFILTYVTTTPTMLVSLEVASQDSDGVPGGEIHVDHSQTIVFENGLLMPEVNRRLETDGVKLEHNAWFRGRKVDAVLDVVDGQYQMGMPWLTPRRWKDWV